MCNIKKNYIRKTYILQFFGDPVNEPEKDNDKQTNRQTSYYFVHSIDVCFQG